MKSLLFETVFCAGSSVFNYKKSFVAGQCDEVLTAGSEMKLYQSRGYEDGLYDPYLNCKITIQAETVGMCTEISFVSFDIEEGVNCE